MELVDFVKDDDFEILQQTYLNGGITFSNDKFLDYILNDNIVDEIRNTIRYRVVPYSMNRETINLMDNEKFMSKAKNRYFTGIKLELKPTEERNYFN